MDAAGKWDSANPIRSQFARHFKALTEEGFNASTDNVPMRAHPKYERAANHFPPTMRNHAIGFPLFQGFSGIIRLTFRDLAHFVDCMAAAQWTSHDMNDKSYTTAIRELDYTQCYIVFPNGDVVLCDATN